MFVFQLMNLHFLKRHKKSPDQLGYAKIDSNQTTISAKLPFCSNQCLRSLERFFAGNLSNNPPCGKMRIIQIQMCGFFKCFPTRYIRLY